MTPEGVFYLFAFALLIVTLGGVAYVIEEVIGLGGDDL